ncbi:transposase [Haloferula sp.]|uniref:transposase n=1 Tax=Haloferula sp. TaxID=2497595 RepID=UPI003C792CEB
MVTTIQVRDICRGVYSWSLNPPPPLRSQGRWQQKGSRAPGDPPPGDDFLRGLQWGCGKQLDPTRADVSQLAQIYRARWAIEIQFRAWKQLLNLTGHSTGRATSTISRPWFSP